MALLIEEIEEAFEEKEKAGLLLIDLTAAYDTVWHRGLTLKLLQCIPSKGMVRLIMNMLTNRSFILHLGSENSKQRRLLNGVPQGSVLAPILFNIYTADIPNCTSRKFIYADDIALLRRSRNFEDLESCLSNDLSTFKEYFQNWRLKLNLNKTVSSTFHLANRFAQRQLSVKVDNTDIPFQPTPKY